MTVIVLSFNVCLRTVNWHLLPSYWISEMLLVHLFQETSQVATVICIFYSCPIDYFMQSSMFILHWDISKADQNFYSWSASNFLQGNFLLAFYFKYKITLVITYPPNCISFIFNWIWVWLSPQCTGFFIPVQCLTKGTLPPCFEAP